MCERQIEKKETKINKTDGETRAEWVIERHCVHVCERVDLCDRKYRNKDWKKNERNKILVLYTLDNITQVVVIENFMWKL